MPAACGCPLTHLRRSKMSTCRSLVPTTRVSREQDMVYTLPGRLMTEAHACCGGARGSHARTVASQLPVSTRPSRSGGLDRISQYCSSSNQ